MKEAQEETGTGKTGETMRESPETAGEPEPDGGQADSVREETDSKDEPQAEAEQPSEEEDFKLAEKPKKVSRRTSAAKGTGTARTKNS